MNSFFTCIFLIICTILVSSVNAQGSHFYTLPDAEMAAREQQEVKEGFRIKSSKRSSIANKDWMGTPLSRQQSNTRSSSSLRKNKLKKVVTFDNVDTIDMGLVKESIRNDHATDRTTSFRASASSSRQQANSFDFSWMVEKSKITWWWKKCRVLGKGS